MMDKLSADERITYIFIVIVQNWMPDYIKWPQNKEETAVLE